MPNIIFEITHTKNTYSHGSPIPLTVMPNGSSSVPFKIPYGIEALSSNVGISVMAKRINMFSIAEHISHTLSVVNGCSGLLKKTWFDFRN